MTDTRHSRLSPFTTYLEPAASYEIYATPDKRNRSALLTT